MLNGTGFDSTALQHVLKKRVKGRGKGFASMTPEERSRIASLGGKAAHAQGTAHKWNSETAKIAGRKGGSISRRRSKDAMLQKLQKVVGES